MTKNNSAAALASLSRLDSAFSYSKSALAVFFACAFLLRLILISINSYWADEIFSVSTVWQSSSFADYWQHLKLDSSNAALFGSILYVANKLFGYSETVSRFPSLIASMLSLWYFFKLARRLLPAEAVWGALFFFAFSSQSIYHAAEARCYAILLFLSVYCINRYLELWPLKPAAPVSAKQAIGFAAAAAALSLTHYFGIFLLISLFLWRFGSSIVFKQSRKELLKLLASLSAAAALFLALWGGAAFNLDNSSNLLSWGQKELQGPLLEFLQAALLTSKPLALNIVYGLWLAGGTLYAAKQWRQIRSALFFMSVIYLSVFLIVYVLSFWIYMLRGRYFMSVFALRALFTGLALASSAHAAAALVARIKPALAQPAQKVLRAAAGLALCALVTPKGAIFFKYYGIKETLQDALSISALQDARWVTNHKPAEYNFYLELLDSDKKVSHANSRLQQTWQEEQIALSPPEASHVVSDEPKLLVFAHDLNQISYNRQKYKESLRGRKWLLLSIIKKEP